jgi:D-alanyl-D-alanine carboxypeptidase
LAANPAEARRYKKHHRGHHRVAQTYAPPFAAIAVDVKTGRTLYQKNADAMRHPASLTKVMTLYMLFEQLEKGNLSLDSEILVSRHAAAQPPTKMGIRPGGTIEVEDAIKALVTRSANDIAVAIAEKIGGSEENFAAMMTRKAHALGMTRTTYVNASGLPDVEQVTTARDLAILAQAVQQRFPRYYGYFSLKGFNYAGSWIPNHNHLLGRIEGVDGIKTGYTRMSGFNLMTNVKTDDRHVVAVVLGGRSAAIRDRQMAQLIDEQLPRAYAGRPTAPAIAERAVNETVKVASRRAAPQDEDNSTDEDTAESEGASQPTPVAQAEPAKSAVDKPALAKPTVMAEAPAKAEPIKAEPVKAEAPKAPLDLTNVKPVVASAGVSMPTTTPSAFRWVTGPQPVAQAPARPAEPIVRATAYAPEPKPMEAKALDPEPRRVAKAEADDIDPRTTGSTGWIIQLAATEDEASAREILSRAKTQVRSLAHASPFTEKVSKGGTTLWRARFSGFNPDSAQAACKALKRDGFACFATRS